MNNKLSALMTKLNWQLHEAEQEFVRLEQQVAAIDEKQRVVIQKISSASLTPTQIIPEREIASMCFIMTQQQQHDELAHNKNAVLSQKSSLHSKILRLKTEATMLEKYQQTQKNLQLKQQIAMEQNAMDEWIIQRKESV